MIRPLLLMSLATTILSADAVMTSEKINENELFPFVIPWDDATPGFVSRAHTIDAPAGRHGHVYARDGRLWLDRPAVPDAPPSPHRFRIVGVNLAFAANFPTRENAEKLALRLAHLGINSVRFHHFDRDPAPKGIWQADGKTIDPAQLDRLDYLIAQLKRRGIYSNLNLHVSRVYPDHPTWEGMPPFHKAVDLFTPSLIQLQKNYAAQLLLHRNPYTGLTYREDPAIVIVEINNETGLVSRWWEKQLDAMPAFFADELLRQWRVWRSARNLPAHDALLLRRDYDDAPEALRREWMRFLWDTELAYWRDMRAYLRHDLQVRSLIVGTQLYTYSPLPMQAEMDVVDIHAYWEHPEFPHAPKNRDIWTVGNTSLTSHPDARTLSELALQRVSGKPLIVTEYNHPSPNTHSSEALILFAAYAAMQDWDGVYIYSWSHGNQPPDSGRAVGHFDIDRHSQKLVTLPQASAIFRDFLVSTPSVVQETTGSAEQFLAFAVHHGVNIDGTWFGARRQDALRRPQTFRLLPPSSNHSGIPQSALRIPPSTYSGPIASDTGELIWDAHPEHATFTLNAPKSKALVGRTDNRSACLGPLTIRPSATQQGWSAITLTQFEGGPIGTPGRALLTANGYLQNTGQLWKTSSRDSIARWGEAPLLVEGIPAELTFTLAPGLRLHAWALDERGQRHAALPVDDSGSPASTARIAIGPEYKTIWYEILVTPE